MQTYVKQKLGETLELGSTEIPPKVVSPATPSSPKGVVITSTVNGTTVGERWDPNKQLDKLKSGVISRLRQQQRTRYSTTTPEHPSMPMTGEGPPTQITVDDGNT